MAYSAYPVWMFPPNWGEGVLERLQWKTQMLVSETGIEQRVARRLTPRRSFEVSFLVEGRVRQFFENFLTKHGAEDLLVPMWHNLAKLTAAAASGTNVLTVDTRWREFEVGNTVMLRGADPWTWEVGIIQSKTDSSLTLVSNLEASWANGTMVYPGFVAHIEEGNTNTRKITDTAISARMVFISQQANRHTNFWGYPPIHDFGWVYEQHTDESEDLTFEFNRYLDEVDNQVGIPSVLDRAGRDFRQRAFRWGFAGRQQHHEFRAFLHYMRGKVLTAWFPTYAQDLKLISDIEPFDLTIDVINTGYASMAGSLRGKQDIRIEMQNGFTVYRKITGAEEIDADTERLTLHAPLFWSMPAADVKQICFMMEERFDQDEIEIEHPVDGEGLVKCSVILQGNANPTRIILTSKPYPLYELETMDVAGLLESGRYIVWPIEGVDVSALLFNGTLRQPLRQYTDWPEESIDLAGLLSSGNLRVGLKTYVDWPEEPVDLSGQLPSGNLRVGLVSYHNWTVMLEAIDVSGLLLSGSLT